MGEIVGTPAQRKRPPIPLSPKVIVLCDGAVTDAQTAVAHERESIQSEKQVADALPKRGRRSARRAGVQAAVDAEHVSSTSEKQVVNALPETVRKSMRHAVAQTSGAGMGRHKKCAESPSRKQCRSVPTLKVVSKRVILTEDDMLLSQLQSMMHATTVLSEDNLPLSQLQAKVCEVNKQKRKSSITLAAGSKSKRVCMSKM